MNIAITIRHPALLLLAIAMLWYWRDQQPDPPTPPPPGIRARMNRDGTIEDYGSEGRERKSA